MTFGGNKKESGNFRHVMNTCWLKVSVWSLLYLLLLGDVHLLHSSFAGEAIPPFPIAGQRRNFVSLDNPAQSPF